MLESFIINKVFILRMIQPKILYYLEPIFKFYVSSKMNIIKTIKSKRYLLISLQIIVFISVYLGVKMYTQRDLAQSIPPELNASLITGEKFNLQTKSNAPRLLHFWASWCPVCKLEENGIEAIAKDHPTITVAMQSGEDLELEHYMRTQALSFAVIADNNGAIARKFGVKAVPVSFILNTDGKIVFIESGYTSSWGLRIRLWLARFF